MMTTYKSEAERIITHIRNMIAVIPPAISIVDISDDAAVVVVVVSNTELDAETMDRVVIEGS